jgi:hypothetical protein
LVQLDMEAQMEIKPCQLITKINCADDFADVINFSNCCVETFIIFVRARFMHQSDVLFLNIFIRALTNKNGAQNFGLISSHSFALILTFEYVFFFLLLNKIVTMQGKIRCFVINFEIVYHPFDHVMYSLHKKFLHINF